MEPENINFSTREDEQLRALLGAELPPLPAGAFTARVVAALPPPRRSAVRPVWWAIVGALVGLAFAWVKGGSWTDQAAGFTSVATAFAPVLAVATDPWLSLALVITAFSLLLTFMINRQFASLLR